MTEFIHFAYALRGQDRGRALQGTEEIAGLLQADEPAWLHMQADHPGTRQWIEENLGYLPGPVRQSLLETETRPRAAIHGEGVLLILRGLNTNPGADPEDMVSIRLWVDAGRVISLSKRPLASVAELAEDISMGEGPDSEGALLASLVERLHIRIERYLARLDDTGDQMEYDVLHDPEKRLRADLTDLRGELVDLRRFLVPQRDAIGKLPSSTASVLQQEDRLRLTESHDRLTRLVEEVEGLRDRLVVVKDELAAALSERLNRNLYLLSVISAVFLPLGVLTGLMGINLAGMPGASWPPAFWVFTGILLVILMIQVVLLRSLRWL